MNGAFLDSVGMIAVWDVADQWHPAAEIGLSEVARPWAAARNNGKVLLECGNAAARRPYRRGSRMR